MKLSWFSLEVSQCWHRYLLWWNEWIIVVVLSWCLVNVNCIRGCLDDFAPTRDQQPSACLHSRPPLPQAAWHTNFFCPPVIGHLLHHSFFFMFVSPLCSEWLFVSLDRRKDRLFQTSAEAKIMCRSYLQWWKLANHIEKANQMCDPMMIQTSMNVNVVCFCDVIFLWSDL